MKANQAVLLEDLQDHIKLVAPMAEEQTFEKGHGRIEGRKASFYSVKAICFEENRIEERWDQSGFATLVVVGLYSSAMPTSTFLVPSNGSRP